MTGREKDTPEVDGDASVKEVLEAIEQTLRELDEVEAMYRELRGLDPEADVPLGETP